MDILVSAFTSGGWGLVVAVAVAYGIKILYQKLSQKFEELSEKVDSLRDEVTELKVQGARFEQAIQSCGEPNCPNKALLKKNKDNDE